MHTTRALRAHRSLLTAGALAVVLLTDAVPAGAAPTADVSSAAVAAELERLADTTAGSDRAADDDSTTTACRAPVTPVRTTGAVAPDPLAYINNRIVLRTSRSTDAARDAVAGALAALGSPAGIGPIETIRPLALDGFAEIRVLVVPLVATPPVDVVELARTLRQDPYRITASPDYLLSPSSGPTEFWPDGFPTPIPTADLTAPRTGAPGSGQTIAVYDTGVAPPAQSNNPPNLSRLRASDRETVDADGDGTADAYFSGHTTAIAGVLQVIAPGAAVKAVRITEPATGVASDVSATRVLAATLGTTAPAAWPPVIVAAFGSQACLVDPAVPGGAEMVPLGLQAVTEAVDVVDRAVVVASAGNRGTTQKFYPAAFAPSRPSAVVSVGALDTSTDPDADPWTAKSRTGPRASFSAYGPWVTAWAPGLALPVHHVRGLDFDPGVPAVEGAALVDGTSFAGPVVAGLIAETMTRQGVDVDTAWSAVRSAGVTCDSRSGRGVAVALTSLTATATTKATAPRAATDC